MPVRLAGFLPLAISLLARVYNRHASWTLADLMAETRTSMPTFAAEKDSVAAAFDVSYRVPGPWSAAVLPLPWLASWDHDRRLRRDLPSGHTSLDQQALAMQGI